MIATAAYPIEGVKAPMWFYFVATFSLLWNIMGFLSFVIEMTITPEAMTHMSPEQVKLYESTPVWVELVFGFAVISGVLGCLLLILKKAISYKVLLVSLVAVLVQMGYVFGIQHAAVVLGAGSLILPSAVILWGIFLVWFSHFSITKQWLT
ncbi:MULTISPECIES: hypothetical protein [Shewanella]|uniref:hypothetical protein n=1 Tax=Shewanella TaxID=22 RepID=UPI0018E8FF41|nr:MULTISPECIES: hypothetical protein [Shewanella]